jgi:DNA-binding winged helix-turn-helix (wHTH) protein/tetratricopeptide (TPR) repeat protein
MERQCYAFGGFRIDTQSRVLFQGGERVSIPPKAAELLLALLERGGELVAKEELMKAAWPDTFVEENNLARHIFQLRKTLGENEQGQPFIETIPKRGYRFVGRIDRERPAATHVINYEEHSLERIVIEEQRSDPGFKKQWLAALVGVVALCVAGGLFLRARVQGTGQWRSVLVLPFRSSGGPDDQIGSAFAQEVAARLRTIPSLTVASPLTNVRNPGAAPPADTILTGRLDLSADRLRVSAQLRSSRNDTLVWAEEVTDLDPGDLQSALVRMGSSLAVRLCGRLLPGERVRLEGRGSTNAEAYQAYLHGRAEMLRTPMDSSRGAERAAGYFETAIRLDPGFADAWAGLARAQHSLFAVGKASRPLLSTAIGNAQRALSIDPENILAREVLIRIYHSTGQNEDMLREAKRALEINRTDPDAQSAAAMAYFRTAMLDRAIDLYEQYVIAHPDDEDAWYQLVHACLFAKSYDRGLRHAQHLVAVQRLMFPTFLLYLNSGDLTHAVALARQSVAHKESLPAAAYFAGLVIYAAGQEAEASAAWKDAAERMNASLRKAENERTRMFLGLVYARLHEPDAARDQVRRAMESQVDAWVLFFSSELYAILGDRSAAIQTLRQSVAAGFLGLHYLDYYQQSPNGWYAYRQDPEFVLIHDGLAHRIAELRTRY